MKSCMFMLLMLALTPAWGATLLVKNAAGEPLAQAMVTRTPQKYPPQTSATMATRPTR